MNFRLETPTSVYAPSTPYRIRSSSILWSCFGEVTCKKMITRSPRIVGTSEVEQNLWLLKKS